MLAACSYPVILNISVGCSLKQQVRLHHYLCTILGSRLALPPAPAKEDQNQSAALLLPSPTQLMGKVLVLVRALLHEVILKSNFARCCTCLYCIQVDPDTGFH